jgi:hypothetical protein
MRATMAVPGRREAVAAVPDTVCAVCGKSVVSDRGRVEVREGERVFHLDCYRLYKRRAPLSDPDGILLP